MKKIFLALSAIITVGFCAAAQNVPDEVDIVTDENVKLYGRCITVYEPNQATGDGQGNELVRLGKDKYQLNGKEASEFTFGYDYYWMMGDNRDNSLDSRYWGFVPEDHIVGTPLFVWFSINQETGEWRKDRWLKKVKGL